MTTIDENLNIIIKPIECKCPMCEKLHVKELCWNEPFRPRVYCDECRKKVWIVENDAHRRTVERAVNAFMSEKFDDNKDYKPSSSSDYSMDHFYEGEDDKYEGEGDE